jgi:hypothetical protein
VNTTAAAGWSQSTARIAAPLENDTGASM